MREQLRQKMREMVATLGKGEALLDSRVKKKNTDMLEQLLEDMQNSAIAIGKIIEQEEGYGTKTVAMLEEYCELLYEYLTKTLSQNQGSQKHGQDSAGFINGSHLVHIPQLKSPEIEQPGSPCGHTGQYQKQTGSAAYGSYGTGHSGKEHHNPRKHKNHCGTDRGSQIRVRIPDADFR